MASLPTLPPEARRILDLARRDRRAAREVLGKLDLDAQVALVCTTPPSRRAELLDLAPDPDRLVAALPEAELCFTVKALGLHDAGWILAHASAEQLVACVDLDAWRDLAPDRSSLDAWLRAAADAGEDTLLRLVRNLDHELLVLLLSSRLDVHLKTSDDFEPPLGARTLDGQFYFRARAEGDDLAEIEALLGLLFQSDYWFYFRLLQAVQSELEAETEEWALRWRNGRLEDLGFPPWSEAGRIYGVIPADRLAEIPQERFREADEYRLPVWLPELPVGPDAGASLWRAMAALDADERRPHLLAFLTLANRVAVADRMPLGDAETLPQALEKAAQLASLGLDYIVSQAGLEPADVLRQVSVERLFRVGFSLAPRPSGATG